MTYSCSRSKDTFTSRLYHQTTAKYNGYFYAKESINEGIATIEVNYQENYKEILPVFVYGDEKDAKNVFPQMDRAIFKTSTVIDRHAMTIKKKEVNKWIKYNYLVMGKAYFYKKQYDEAIKVFDFIIKQYKDDDIKFEATLWMVRTKMELEEYGRASTLLKLLSEESSLSIDLLSDFKSVYADFYIRKENYKKAIESLEEAIIVTKKKKRRARLTYILAQLYEQQSRSTEAIAAYQRVVKMHPNYEMVFYASINQAMAYNTRDGDSMKIKKLLIKMIKDNKNIDYFDQIYYALATLELEDGNKFEGIEYLILSTKNSISNNEQKGISFMTLGDVYMEDRHYKQAKSYYDSTLLFLPKEYETFSDIKDLDEGLSNLIINLDVIELQDSLIHLASLTEKEREKILLEIITAEEDAENERIEALIAERENSNKKSMSASVPLSNSSGKSGKSKGDWYFYNTNSMSFGYSEFQRNWGGRELKDDWRRSNSSSGGGLTSINSDESGNLQGEEFQRNSIRSLQEYMQDIPLSDEAMEASKVLLEEALYNAGVIYNENLDDIDNAIDMFDELTQRFPNSKYLATSYYQLYRLYVKKESNGNYFGAGYRDNSEYYKGIILEDFPLTEYAKIIRNPNYLKDYEIAQRRREEDYIATYRNFKSHRYNTVLEECNRVIANELDNPFLAKYYFMKAFIVGKRSNNKDNFIRELLLIADKYPETEEGKEAVAIIAELNKTDLKVDSKSEPKKVENKTDFIVNNNVEHFFALIYPNNKGNVNTVKASISDFNKKYYSNEKLKVTNSFINKNNQIVIVRRFSNAEKALGYYSNFIDDEDKLNKINEEGFTIFLISSKNFTKLFKSGDIEGYDSFFQDTYL
jgi:tetratricopeptide (TPR) repeat protein